MDGWDVDLPTRLEASYVCNLVAKLLWATAYIAVYGLRPIIIKPKPIGAAPPPPPPPPVPRASARMFCPACARGLAPPPV